MCLSGNNQREILKQFLKKFILINVISLFSLSLKPVNKSRHFYHYLDSNSEDKIPLVDWKVKTIFKPFRKECVKRVRLERRETFVINSHGWLDIYFFSSTCILLRPVNRYYPRLAALELLSFVLNSVGGWKNELT